MTLLVAALTYFLVASLLACLMYRRELAACWREPVLRYPVLIVESDDWGAGPLSQAQVLERLRALLLGLQDESGRHPVITLGVVLAVPDSTAMRMSGGQAYHAADLRQPPFHSILQQMLAGMEQGVFAPQLHGKEHYWPPSVMQAAAVDPGVGDWLVSEDIPNTEALPSHLQARWTDASSLPSSPLPKQQVRDAVAEEARLFEECFGRSPRVAVATTFVWNQDVEDAWAKHGINAIITPGARYTLRDAEGKPGGLDKKIFNGARSTAGPIYLVRDVYFEPALGHDSERLRQGALEHVHLGRPVLVETHRFNFLGDEAGVARNLQTLEMALRKVLESVPGLRFMSSEELANMIRSRAPELMEQQWAPRARVWLRRIGKLHRFRKLATISGLGALLRLAGKALRA